MTVTVTGDGWSLTDATVDLAVGEWYHIVGVKAGPAPAKVCAKVAGIPPPGSGFTVYGAAQVCTTIKP